MRFNRILIIVVIVVLFFGAGIYYYTYHFSRSNVFYILTNMDVTLQESDPVYVDGIPVGKVSNVYISRFTKDKKFIRFLVDKKYSIPKKSTVEIQDNTNKKGGSININLLASRDYVLPGDTFFLYEKPVVELKNTDDLVKSDGEKKNKHPVREPVEGVIYKIQLRSSKIPIPKNSKMFKGINNIEELFIEGYYKYYKGNLSTFEEAKKLRRSIQDQGIQDAFIVPFSEGKRITIKQALKLEK